MFFLINSGQTNVLNLPHRCQQSSDAVSVQCAGLQMFRIVIGLLFQKTVDSGTTAFKGTDLYLFSHVKSACSLGTHEALMSGKAEYVDLHSLYINGQHSRSLGRIHHK